MKKIIVAFILFLFPTALARLLFRIVRLKSICIEKDAKIGFSIIYCNEFRLSGGARIGHLNFFDVDSIRIGKNARIKHLNFCKGDFCVILENNIYINHTNKISALHKKIGIKPVFHMKEFSHITVGHVIDMADSVTIGKGSWIAGCDTHLWTHSFFLSRLSYKNKKICNPITIGNHVYVGARCSIMPGVYICDGVTIGAQTCISKDLNIPGLYVSQPIRHIAFDPDIKIDNDRL